jgi:hypothetical protein
MSVVGKIDLGMPTVVFNRTATGSGDTFSLPSKSRDNHGALILQGIGRIGAAPGTITALVVDLEVSLDNEVTWNKLVTGITLTTLAISVNVAGLGGGVHCRLTSTTFTLNSATSIVIYAHAG